MMVPRDDQHQSRDNEWSRNVTLEKPSAAAHNARRCQGPIVDPGDWPSETCDAIATHGFFFPHRGGVAFIFACPIHVLDVGGWGGRHFGGCFGDVVAKTPEVIRGYIERGTLLSFPHGHDYDQLVPVPNPPKAPPHRHST